VTEDGRTIPVTAPDQVAIIATLDSGAAASVFYRGGTSRGDNFRWEINGTDGDLVLTADWGNMQVAPLTLAGGRGSDTAVRPIGVPGGDARTPADGVARLYAALARDLADDTRTVPDFELARRRHRLIDAVERASATGVTQAAA